MANYAVVAREYNKLCKKEKREDLMTYDDSGGTLARWSREIYRGIRVRQRLLPILSEINQMIRLKWALDEVFEKRGEGALPLLDLRYDIKTDGLSDKYKKKVSDAMHGTDGKPVYGYIRGKENEVTIHCDEKWFVQAINGNWVRIFPDENGDYKLPGNPRGNKRHIPKVMAFVAAGQPIWKDGVCIFDGTARPAYMTY